MYLNVVTLKNGRNIPFTTETPYSVDKVNPGWNIIVDTVNGSTVSFIGDEVVHIGNQDIDKIDKPADEDKPIKEAKHFTINK